MPDVPPGPAPTRIMPSKSVAGESPAVRLVGREPERDVLDQFLAALRGGESQALVVLGEPGGRPVATW
jgi:hypothetical protein